MESRTPWTDWGSLGKALQPKTDADKASSLKAQADLITQQQRLIGCQVSSSICK